MYCIQVFSSKFRGRKCKIHYRRYEMKQGLRHSFRWVKRSAAIVLSLALVLGFMPQMTVWAGGTDPETVTVNGTGIGEFKIVHLSTAAETASAYQAEALKSEKSVAFRAAVLTADAGTAMLRHRTRVNISARIRLCFIMKPPRNIGRTGLRPSFRKTE